MDSKKPTSRAQGHPTLALLEQIKDQLLLVAEGQDRQTRVLEDIRRTIDGFTSGGASFNSHQTDPFSLAYISIIAPALAGVMKKAGDELSLPEILKGAILLSREALDELGAYRSVREGKDYLQDQLSTINDPWKKKQD